MKKNGILKALGIVFLIYVILSWIIPTGIYSSGAFTKGTTAPVGLFDLIRYPIINLTSSVFVLTAVVLLFIGGLYAVANKTGAYANLVKKVADKYKDKGEVFLTISILVFAILSSLTALVLPLFALVPFFVAVILLLGYNKSTAILSTVGAILVGNIGSTYGFNINGYLSYFYSTDIHSSIWYRLGLFLALTVALIVFVIKTAKKTGKKDETKDIPLYRESKSECKSTAIVILFVLMMIISLVGMFNWYNSFGIDWFDNIHSSITEFEINGYPIFANLLGSISSMGYWSNYEFALMLVLTSLIIGKVYGLKLSDIVQSFVDGCKKMLPVAVMAIAANIIFLLMNSSDTGYTFYATICNWLFTMTDKLTVVTTAIASMLGGVFYNDFPYMINAVVSQVSSLDQNLNVISLVQQAFHGLVCLVAPTSVILVAGLTYLNVSYKEWLKNTWKYLLLAMVIIIVVLVIMILI